MLTHIDILLAVWDEQPEAGIGGTGQIVREAQERGLPVVNLLLDGGVALWLPDSLAAAPGADWRRFEPGDSLCAGELADGVRAMLSPPADAQSRERFRAFLAEPSRRGSRAFAYDLLRRRCAGRGVSFRVEYALGPDEEAGWRRMHEAARRIGGERLAQAMRRVIESRWRHADNAALHCSHLYRSAYVMNFFLAALAGWPWLPTCYP